MRRLPPLRALLAFETTARHLSLTRAADELNLSASAVSHQLRTLEDYLGMRLLHRSTRSVSLTDAGYSYLLQITGGLDRIAIATDEAIDAGYTDVLTVQCPPSFAPAWLMPRLGRFIARHPAIDLRIRATPDPVDLLRSSVDLEIRYGLGEVSGLVARPLLQESIEPLVSPEWLPALSGVDPHIGLGRIPLIHSERSPLSWSKWLRAQQMVGPKVSRGLRFDRAYLSIQAARAGLGIALESTVFAARELDDGSLVKAFPTLAAARSTAHYVVSTENNLLMPKVIAFRDWLVSEAAQSA